MILKTTGISQDKSVTIFVLLNLNTEELHQMIDYQTVDVAEPPNLKKVCITEINTLLQLIKISRRTKIPFYTRMPTT